MIANCAQLSILSASGCGVYLPEAQVYDGDSGGEAAHEDGKSSFQPQKITDASIKVPHMRVFCELAGKLTNQALQGGVGSKQPVVLGLPLALGKTVSQSYACIISRMHLFEVLKWLRYLQSFFISSHMIPADFLCLERKNGGPGRLPPPSVVSLLSLLSTLYLQWLQRGIHYN